MGIHLNCREATEQLSEYLDGGLPFVRAFQVWVHLFFCPSCRALAATLKALPPLVEDPDPDALASAGTALEGALARIARKEADRPWPGTPVPGEALDLLQAGPDPALALLAEAHAQVARARTPLPGPYHLPAGVLDRLPPESQWAWVDGAQGRRRTELLHDPVRGQRLVLAYVPVGVKGRAHRHLGSESILVLAGSMVDQGQTLTPGDWVHHATGSIHAPSFPEKDCWCLIREEGDVAPAGPLERLRSAR